MRSGVITVKPRSESQVWRFSFARPGNFEGDQGRDVRVAEIPESMADTANEHRAQVLLSIIVHRITARTQICR